MIEKHRFQDITAGIVGHRVIHRKSDNTLLVFGGYDNGIPFGRLHIIRKYYIDDDKWFKLRHKTPVKMDTFGCIMALDERYAVFMNGMKNFGNSEEIYICDLESENLTFSVSEILRPESDIDTCNAILMYRSQNKHELLIYGYLRNMILDTETEDVFIPSDIACCCMLGQRMEN